MNAKWFDLCQKWGRFPHWCTQASYWHQKFSAHLLLMSKHDLYQESNISGVSLSQPPLVLLVVSLPKIPYIHRTYYIYRSGQILIRNLCVCNITSPLCVQYDVTFVWVQCDVTFVSAISRHLCVCNMTSLLCECSVTSPLCVQYRVTFVSAVWRHFCVCVHYHVTFACAV